MYVLYLLCGFFLVLFLKGIFIFFLCGLAAGLNNGSRNHVKHKKNRIEQILSDLHKNNNVKGSDACGLISCPDPMLHRC